MQMYPVQEFDPSAKPRHFETITVEWDGFIIVASPNDLDQLDFVVSQINPPVRHLTELWVQILCYDELLKLYVTKIEDLEPLIERFTDYKGYAPDIVMTEQGFKDIVKYNPVDPTTDPILCKDCGT